MLTQTADKKTCTTHPKPTRKVNYGTHLFRKPRSTALSVIIQNIEKASYEIVSLKGQLKCLKTVSVIQCVDVISKEIGKQGRTYLTALF